MDRMGVAEIAELARLAREGDVAARNRIFEAHTPILRAVARRRSGPGMDFDDAYQEGAIGLLKAAAECDPDRADCFPKLAITRSRGAILNGRPRHAEVIRVHKYDRLPDGSSPIRRETMPDWDAPEWAVDPDDQEASVRAWRLDAALRSLTTRDAELMCRVHGLWGRAPEAPIEVARSLGVREEAIASRLQRARAKVRAHIEESEATGRDWRSELDDIMTEDLTGRTFGRLYVEGISGIREETTRWRYWRWRCSCRCGSIVDVRAASLTSGNSPSCGCISAEKANARARRLEIDGRAMTVAQWSRESGFSPSTIWHRLDRGMDEREAVFGGRPGKRPIEVDGVRRSVSEWSRVNGIPRSTIADRLCHGWDEVEAVTIPVGGDRRSGSSGKRTAFTEGRHLDGLDAVGDPGGSLGVVGEELSRKHAARSA